MATDASAETRVLPAEVTMRKHETRVFCLGPFRPRTVANSPRVAKYVSPGKDYLQVSEQTIGQERLIRVTPSSGGSLISEVGKGVSLEITSTKGENVATIETIGVREGERGISSLWIYNQERKGWEKTSQPPRQWSSVYLLPITEGVVILDKDQASDSEIMASLKQAVNNLLVNETEAQVGGLAPDFRGYRLLPGI